jgi:hypothetical protein
MLKLKNIIIVGISLLSSIGLIRLANIVSSNIQKYPYETLEFVVIYGVMGVFISYIIGSAIYHIK